jgi:SAM-dependent methyltransferase
MRPGREPDLIAAAVPPGSTILELGAGTGRVTNALVARGFDVIAVDDSAEMLAYVRDAETITASIEGIELGRRFDAVLLCSHLINTADAAQRDAFVSACARHVNPDGCVVVERHVPAWFDTATDTAVDHDGICYRLRDVSRPSPDLLSATVQYTIDGRVWTQAFTAQRIDDDALDMVLARSGLVVDRYLDDDRSWLRAVPRRRGEDRSELDRT